ncbi:MAG: type VI secretion system tip protein VgrG [Acidobacteria bacterium]|nr:type VI secretion system tip protein VgrG [Acidobacteriota bacterium]
MSDDRQIPTSAPADRPSFKILSNGTQISGEYQIEAVVIVRSANRVASADIIVLDGDPAAETFAVSDANEFVPGAEIEIQAGYHGQDQSLFKGIVIRHGVKAYRRRPSVLHVECRDAAVKLTVGRKSAYVYDQTDSDVIEQIAGAAGLAKDVEATAVTHKQLVQYYATDWDFVVTRAEANGQIVVTRDGTLVVKKPDPSAAPAVSLRFGGNLLEFEAVMDARTQYAGVKAKAWNPADQAMVEAEAAAPAAVAPGNITSADLAAVIGLSELAVTHAGQLDEQELKAWADGERTRSAFAKVRGRARTQGFAAIYPGDILELAGAGKRFNGKALVSGVRHEISAQNWETDLAFGLSTETLTAAQGAVADSGANGLLPPIDGLQIGLVTALEGDPDGEERIQVHVPAIDPAGQGTWARLATLDAGASRGTVFRPEIGDEVVLGFLNRDPRNPVVVGQLHSSTKASPIPPSDDNHKKGLVTREGIELTFDDEKKVAVLKTPNGNTVTLSDDAGGITIEDENTNTITMNADGITIEDANGNTLTMSADGVAIEDANGNTLTMEASAVAVESAADLLLKATGNATVEGSNVEATAQAQFKAEGSAGAEVSSSASTTIKGSIVQIN